MNDTLTKFNQLVPAGTKALSFGGTSTQDMESSFAVTFPDGDAALFPITVSGHAYQGKLPFANGKGIYQLEINASNGFAIFNLPVYYGVAYAPPSPRPQYPPDNPSATPAQLEAEALLVINTLRGHYHRLGYSMTPALENEARAHSLDIVTHNYFTAHPHTGSDGSDTSTRVTRAGVKFARVGEDVPTTPPYGEPSPA